MGCDDYPTWPPSADDIDEASSDENEEIHSSDSDSESLASPTGLQQLRQENSRLLTQLHDDRIELAKQEESLNLIKAAVARLEAQRGELIMRRESRAQPVCDRPQGPQHQPQMIVAGILGGFGIIALRAFVVCLVG